MGAAEEDMDVIHVVEEVVLPTAMVEQ